MAKYATLAEAMDAKDELAEAEMRYRLLAESFEANPQLRANLSPSLDRVKAEIVRLRAAGPKSTRKTSAEVVAFDPNRFRKSEPATGNGKISKGV